MKPQNLEERLVFWVICGTYVMYLLGAQSLIVPGTAWFLFGYLIYKLWHQTDETPEAEKIRIPVGVWVWIGCVLTIAVALAMGNIEQGRPFTQTIKSLINVYGRGWALMAVFPLIGCLKIRAQIIYRAVAIVCVQSLIILPICFLCKELHVHPELYTSPASKFTGNTAASVWLYTLDEDSNQPRISLFAPWAPALGLIANVYLGLVWNETNQKLKWLGVVTGIVMALASQSRTGKICLLVMPALTFLLSNLSRSSTQISLGLSSLLISIFSHDLFTAIFDYKNNVERQRAGSTAARKALQNIAWYRWKYEAPIWGHALPELGPAITARKPIGSHHTWFGLLFIHGLVGAIAAGFALGWSFITFLITSQFSRTSQAALSVVISIVIYSFSENIEYLSYLYWPGMVLLGIAFHDEVPVFSWVNRLITSE